MATRRQSFGDDLALALGVDGNGNYGGEADDAAALAHFQVDCVSSEIRQLAGQRALQERVHPVVDLVAELLTDDLLIPLISIACISSFTRRVLTPASLLTD